LEGVQRTMENMVWEGEIGNWKLTKSVKRSGKAITAGSLGA